MATATIDGIATRYEVMGAGPPLLMYAPGGFNAVIETWRSQSVYAKIKLLDHLPKAYTCIVFDRRECGQSGGRLERVTWAHLAAHGKGLLDHLGIARAHIMGGCMGCPPVATFGLAYPEATLSMVLFWPVGGARYRINSHRRFAEHLAFVQQHGLDAVVALVAKEGKPFGADSARRALGFGDPPAMRASRRLSPRRTSNVTSSWLPPWGERCSTATPRRAPEPEDMLRLDIPVLIVPGRDTSHATSAARYLEECLPKSEYWDIPVAEQTAANVPARIVEFLDRVSAASS